MKIYRNKTFGSALLVGGTSIGAGMLALPLATGAAGFWGSSLLLCIAFAFMLLSVFFLLEATLMSDKVNANLITICKERLGSVGEFVAWLSFLMLLYAVAAAYLSGGGSLIADVLGAGLKTEISPNMGIFIFLAVFGFIVVFETKAVDAINRICMAGLIGTFVFLLIFVTPHVDVDHYRGGKPQYLWAAVPVVVLSFTSHIIVPSLRSYLSGDVASLKKAFLFGSLIPLVFYLVWEFLIIGLLPLTGKHGLETIGGGTHPVAGLTDALNAILGIPWVAILVGLFSFFALLTSFFGVALSLYDFLADGFKIKKTIKGRAILLVFMFTPPLLFALFYPSGFVLALGYAGVFVAILYGILPALMVWHGRYKEQKEERFRVFGGKVTLTLMLAGSLAIIFFQIAATQGWLPTL
ncbi:amino acid permease [Candidatus Neptunochlamydia vexilliferae]|uniref:Tyrosine-specific transport protein n=1 Tax=Candidatus Neptunichlamydia vexilliferae TaxID=1651774 RepID=A0ABS0AY16_9BACT|nr:aromatic amino acid transport family protein [Candidatus Neptunochlamydia vexilliferae]MBF5059024.1 Tyrosine-specific transport protein [Candidatus Neptunochlamydia vexilliferae]